MPPLDYNTKQIFVIDPQIVIESFGFLPRILTLHVADITGRRLDPY